MSILANKDYRLPQKHLTLAISQSPEDITTEKQIRELMVEGASYLLIPGYAEAATIDA